MDRRDWVLLAIASAQGEALSPVQLQKSVFLLARELTDEQRQTRGFYRFGPYDYGPFCSDVYVDAQRMAEDGLVSIRPSIAGGYRQYAATPAGLERARELRDSLGQTALAYLERVVTWVRTLSFSQLVRAIYKAYPETKQNSVFQG